MSQFFKPKPHKANFLVSKFLRSNVSLPYMLNGNKHAILRFMADIMDATYQKCGSQTCSVTQIQIARFTGIHKNTISSALRFLIQVKLLKLVGKKEDNIGVYELGDIIKSYPQVSQSLVHRGITKDENGITKNETGITMVVTQYNTTSNTTTNTSFENEDEKIKNEERKAKGIEEIKKITNHLLRKPN